MNIKNLIPLSRNEMKAIVGGSFGTCSVQCPGGQYLVCEGPVCAAREGEGGHYDCSSHARLPGGGEGDLIEYKECP